MSQLVYVVAHVQAKPGYEGDVRTALLQLVKVTEAEPGFIRYDLHEDVAKPGHFVFYEIWQDGPSLELHSATEAMRAHQARTRDWVESISVQSFRKINA